MRGWDDGSREPSEESMARVRAGRNPAYSTQVRAHDAVDPAEFLDLLRRVIREVVEEALTARGIAR